MDSTATPADHRHQHQLHQQQQQYQHLSSHTPQVSAAGEAAKQVSTTTNISRADHSSSELLKLTNLKLTDDYLREEAAAGSGAMLVAANDQQQQQQQQQPKIETSSFNEQQHHFTTNSTNFDFPNNTYIGHYENHLYHQNHQQHLSPGAVGGSTTTTSSTANTTGATASPRYTAASASGSFVPGEQYVSVHEPLVVDSFLDMSVIYPQSGAAYSAVDEADPAAASYYQGSAVECGQPEVLRVDHSRSRRTPSGAMGLLQQHHAYYAQSASAAQLGSAGAAAADPQSDSGHVSSVSLTNSLEAIHSSHSQNQHSAGSLLNLSAATATTSSGLVGRHAHSDSFPTAPHLSNLSQHHQHNQHHHHQQQQQQPSQNRLLSCVSEQNFTTYSYSSSNNIIDVGSNNIDQHELQHQHHHEHQHHQEPELKVCEWEGCGNTFLDMEAFVKHLEERHVNQGPKVKNRYFCLWANCKRNEQEFNARYKLLIHMRVHSGEKPYPCNNENCKKSFSRLENLKIHVRSHTGEKPYKCSYERCAKSFTNSSDRIKHHKTHKDPKPYSCNYNGCPKRYTDPSSLRKHLRAHKKAQVIPAIIVGATAAATCASDFDPASLLPADSLMAAATSGAADSSFSGYTPNQQQQQHYQLSRSWCAGARPATAATPTSLAPTSGWLAADHAALNRSFPAPNYPLEAQPPQQQQQYLGIANRAAYEP